MMVSGKRIDYDQVFDYTQNSSTAPSKKGVLVTLTGYATFHNSYNDNNANGHSYPPGFWAKVLDTPRTRDMLETSTFFGSARHPSDSEEYVPDFENVSHVVRDYTIDDKGVHVVVDVLDTPSGRVIKTLSDYGSSIGISTRAYGTVKEEIAGKKVIESDNYFFVTWDLVTYPAFSEARLRAVNDSTRTVGTECVHTDHFSGKSCSGEIASYVKTLPSEQSAPLCDWISCNSTTLLNKNVVDDTNDDTKTEINSGDTDNNDISVSRDVNDKENGLGGISGNGSHVSPIETFLNRRSSFLSDKELYDAGAASRDVEVNALRDSVNRLNKNKSRVGDKRLGLENSERGELERLRLENKELRGENKDISLHLDEAMCLLEMVENETLDSANPSKHTTGATAPSQGTIESRCSGVPRGSRERTIGATALSQGTTASVRDRVLAGDSISVDRDSGTRHRDVKRDGESDILSDSRDSGSTEDSTQHVLSNSRKNVYYLPNHDKEAVAAGDSGIGDDTGISELLGVLSKHGNASKGST